MKSCRLAVVASHPIQYFTPLYRRLASTPGIELDVFYCRDFGISEQFDKQFGRTLRWDVDLLSGYRYRFLTNISPIRDTFNPLHAINPGVFWRMLRGFDAVWVNGYVYPSNWMAIFAAKLTGARVLMRSELRLDARNAGGLRHALREALGRYSIRQSDALLFIGHANREAYRRYGARDAQLFFSPYSVDTDGIQAASIVHRAHRDQLRLAWGIPRDSVVLLFAGKLTARKHPEVLLDLLMDDRIPRQVHLLYVGSGPLEDGLKLKIARTGQDRVTLAGFINQSRMTEAYCLADIFVMPSEREPWGLVLNEAMCAGLPSVVSSDVGAVHDLIEDGKSGFVFDSGDWSTMTECVVRLLNDGDFRDRMGSEAARHAAKYSYDASTRGILEALCALKVYDRER